MLFQRGEYETFGYRYISFHGRMVKQRMSLVAGSVAIQECIKNVRSPFTLVCQTTAKGIKNWLNLFAVLIFLLLFFCCCCAAVVCGVCRGGHTDV